MFVSGIANEMKSRQYGHPEIDSFAFGPVHVEPRLRGREGHESGQRLLKLHRSPLRLHDPCRGVAVGVEQQVPNFGDHKATQESRSSDRRFCRSAMRAASP